MDLFILTTAVPSKFNKWALSDYLRIKRLSQLSHRTDHRIVSDPCEADIILFCGAGAIFHSDIIRSDWLRLYRPKLMILDTSDSTLPLLPGLYTSLKSGHPFINSFYQSFPYVRVAENDSLDSVKPVNASSIYLYSFMGKRENARRLRESVLSLADDRAFLLDNSTGQRDGGMDYALLIENRAPRKIGLATTIGQC